MSRDSEGTLWEGGDIFRKIDFGGTSSLCSRSKKVEAPENVTPNLGDVSVSPEIGVTSAILG